ncbi:MAG: poly-gamma-glutamate biosynthesis protein PgsC [Spirochaetales bacterium]|nr:poly-gamma-glutamate biosynthesis protein PgsC [Spirochaetales bacterium]
MLRTAVVLSVLLGFIGSEFLGILSGGLVSAGYISFYINQPARVASTLLMAVAICLIVRALGHVIILFGRRRFILTMLVSILLTQILESILIVTSSVDIDMRIIGYIIPGLIANDMEKQGIFKTLIMICACAAVIWLVLNIGIF